ncbi:MAG: hypothetical protein ACRC28_01400 [Clostridium sp.]|uniref:hypothetical protein n=1 Tax=Clostridium sp. TaxID=1506 RepID=UPI003F3D26B9
MKCIKLPVEKKLVFNNNTLDLSKVLEKEIDLIQGCIARMSQHSFYLKGWLITLMGILIALKPKDLIVTGIFMIAIVLAFWYLNATYLRYEKQYRKLYEWVITERCIGNTEYLYSLDLKRFENDVEKRFVLMFKNTLLIFYGAMMFVIIGVILIMAIQNKELSNMTMILFK